MNHKYIYSARAHEVTTRQQSRVSMTNKALFLLAMLAIVIFAAESEAGWNRGDYRHAVSASGIITSGLYVASHYAQKYYRKPHSYRHHYRSRNHYYSSRHRSRYYNRYYNKRYYNRQSYGNSYRHRRHY